jgi:hypothetical protein
LGAEGEVITVHRDVTVTRVLPRKRLAAAIVVLGFVEWFLFELVRTPYRPPQDMTTFLGVEKYAVLAVMFLFANGGGGFIAWWAARFIGRNGTLFGSLFCSQFWER